jgi:drug/metabolite transporter (DMT)-like permease
MPQPSLRERLARLHLVWLWLLACGTIVVVSEITNAQMFDEGLGSALFGLLFLIGAPFLAVARVGMAVTAWAPDWLRVIVSLALVLVATTLVDRFVTRWLLGDWSAGRSST